MRWVEGNNGLKGRKREVEGRRFLTAISCMPLRLCVQETTL
jgi:hypothetical protein